MLSLMPADFLVKGLLHLLNHLAQLLAIPQSSIKVLFTLSCLSRVLEGLHELLLTLVTERPQHTRKVDTFISAVSESFTDSFSGLFAVVVQSPSVIVNSLL